MICPRCLAPTTSPTCPACTPRGAVAVAEPADGIDLVARRELADTFSLERLSRRTNGSAVYVGRENGSGRPVAVRTVPRRLLRDAGAESELARAAGAATSLAHPHIVPMLSFGTTAHYVWYASELVDARPLLDIIREGPLELRRCLWMVQQIAGAVQYAHGRGVVHGDLRAEQVCLDAREWVRVGDFGVGAVLADLRGGAQADEARRAIYRAPEATHERRPGPAADQYALAVLVTECLGGVRLSGAARHGERPALAVEVPADLPSDVRDALRRALSERPGDRFRSLLEFVGILEAADVDTKRVIKPVRNPAQLPASAATPRVLRVDRPFSNPRARVAAHAASLTAVVVSVAYLALKPEAPPPAPGPVLAAPVAARSTPPSLDSVPAPPPPAVESRPRATPPRATAPPPRQRPTTVARRPVVSPPAPVPVGPGFISVNSTPWGRVYIDGLFIGHSPVTHVEVAHGLRLLRVHQDGFEPYERVVEIKPGQDLKVVGIVLKGSTP